MVAPSQTALVDQIVTVYERSSVHLAETPMAQGAKLVWSHNAEEDALGFKIVVIIQTSNEKRGCSCVQVGFGTPP